MATIEPRGHVTIEIKSDNVHTRWSFDTYQAATIKTLAAQPGEPDLRFEFKGVSNETIENLP